MLRPMDMQVHLKRSECHVTVTFSYCSKSMQCVDSPQTPKHVANLGRVDSKSLLEDGLKIGMDEQRAAFLLNLRLIDKVISLWPDITTNLVGPLCTFAIESYFALEPLSMEEIEPFL